MFCKARNPRFCEIRSTMTDLLSEFRKGAQQLTPSEAAMADVESGDGCKRENLNCKDYCFAQLSRCKIFIIFNSVTGEERSVCKADHCNIQIYAGFL